MRNLLASFMERSSISVSRPDFGVIIALTMALIIRPLLYTLITPVYFSKLVDHAINRSLWWEFYTWILFWEWIPFGLLCWALRRRKHQWPQIGIDWHFFVRYRIATAAVLVVLTLTAFLAPRYLYHGNVPRVSQTFPFLPVTGPERFFFLIATISAGICEEACYRGLPLRLFARSTRQAWLMLPLTMVAFVFIHGRFGTSHAAYYLLCGFFEGGFFILLGRRRLEWLITMHVLYDSLLILSP